MHPFDRFGDIVEFKCEFGRVYCHNEIAPKEFHTPRLQEIDRVLRTLKNPPETGDTLETEIEYPVKIFNPETKEKVKCRKLFLKFRRFTDTPEYVMDEVFPHQKGAHTEHDMFLETIEFRKS